MSIEDYFRGKGCVVTGAASGIGFALSEALLNVGAIVFMADRDSETLGSAVEQLSPHAGQVHSMTVDVTNQGQVQQLVQDAASRHGRLDVLFNNAGIGHLQSFAGVTLEHWRRIIDINLWGVIYGIDAAVPIMLRQGGGHIVNTSSMAGLMPFPYEALYVTTKYAVVGLSESLRYELEEDGILLSVICPGPVISRIWGKEVPPPSYAIPAEEAAQTMLAGVANKEGIVIVPEIFRALWLEHYKPPEYGETFLRDMARQRRHPYETPIDPVEAWLESSNVARQRRGLYETPTS